MNRCTRPSSRLARIGRAGILTALLLAATAVGAQQSVRPFPPNALRGTLQVTNPPELLLDGRNARFSPGARIHAVNNLLVMSGTLAGQSLVVNYVRDSQGLVH